VQAVTGAVFIYEGDKTYPVFSGGLSFGWRFNLPLNFYVEPEVRFSYPGMWGVSILGGLKFSLKIEHHTSSTVLQTIPITQIKTEIEIENKPILSETIDIWQADVFIQVEMPEHEIQIERGRILNAVYFDPNTAIMIEAYRDLLDEVGLRLKEDPSLLVTLRGYTAYVGTPEGRIALSRERALYCGFYLVNNFGIAQNRITIEYFGADQAPEYAGLDLETWRCVELILHD
jgi:outer membrane protein OmpA-like peptidoglycan-associated protein